MIMNLSSILQYCYNYAILEIVTTYLTADWMLSVSYLARNPQFLFAFKTLDSSHRCGQQANRRSIYARQQDSGEQT
jgi:hypothetical protein